MDKLEKAVVEFNDFDDYTIEMWHGNGDNQEWVHIAIVVKDGEVQEYIDGSLNREWTS